MGLLQLLRKTILGREPVLSVKEPPLSPTIYGHQAALRSPHNGHGPTEFDPAGTTTVSHRRPHRAPGDPMMRAVRTACARCSS